MPIKVTQTARSPLEIQQWLRYLLFKLTKVLGDIFQLHKYTEAAILFPQAECLTSLPIVLSRSEFDTVPTEVHDTVQSELRDIKVCVCV